jgi:pyruvate dehydrogenase E1 component
MNALERVQQRVLWLATTMIHHANKVRESQSGIKVGGHQSSCASMTSIMSALYFAHLDSRDRVSVKPHAAPVLHAINYLLGRLDRRYLTELRSFQGLQSYPSRTKDPDPVDFSTGSVGIGATAAIWSALAHRYVSSRFEVPPAGRHIALVGDAELDEGAVWEAIVDPMVSRLGEVLWVVDVNRQSLDRVVPDIAVGRIRAMFDAAGWQTITIKYGHRLRELFARPGGEALEARIDGMSNEEYQRGLRTRPKDLREWLVARGPRRQELEQVLDGLSDADIAAAIRDLGGHDLGCLLDAFHQADRAGGQPSVVFAYTIKAWRLPTEGHPGNHSALLSPAQWEALAPELGADPADPWATFPDGSAEADLCRAAGRRLNRPAPSLAPVPAVPADLGQPYKVAQSTQQAFGRFLLDVSRHAPDVAGRIVTASPDVASSTNLGGWINKVGIWNTTERVNWFADDAQTLVRWRETSQGQHLELGIAEVNLVGLLGELGVTWARDGQPLLPIGTIYDPFVNRALEPWSFAIYAGGQFILVGTPSGVTLGPEGGAHQSVITPSVALEQPGCVAWEPAFAQDLEWCLLEAISRLGCPDGTSAYFRLTTRPIDQDLADVPADPEAREQRRQDVVSGGYRLQQSPEPPLVTLVGTGAVIPEVLGAAQELSGSNVAVDVICLTSADLVFRAVQARRGLAPASDSIVERLFPGDRASPIVTVIDGHPHTLSFLGGIHGVPTASLGVSGYGQVGDIPELYRYFGIDAQTIVGAAWDLIEEASSSGSARPGPPAAPAGGRRGRRRHG